MLQINAILIALIKITISSLNNSETIYWDSLFFFQILWLNFEFMLNAKLYLDDLSNRK